MKNTPRTCIVTPPSATSGVLTGELRGRAGLMVLLRDLIQYEFK